MRSRMNPSSRYPVRNLQRPPSMTSLHVSHIMSYPYQIFRIRSRWSSKLHIYGGWYPPKKCQPKWTENTTWKYSKNRTRKMFLANVMTNL